MRSNNCPSVPSASIENRGYSIRFRNFQRFENSFILPENFEPQRVFVTLSPDDPDAAGFEKIFDWPETDDAGDSRCGVTLERKNLRKSIPWLVKIRN